MTLPHPEPSDPALPSGTSDGPAGAGAARLSVAALQAENARLRQQLSQFITEARANQGKWRRFDQMERQLIGSGSLHELVDLVLTAYPSAFELDRVSLVLLDASQDIAGLYRDDGASLPEGLLLWSHEGPLRRWFPSLWLPRLEPYVEGHAELFGPGEMVPQSVALLPLVHRGRCVGCLSLGSRDRQRYGPHNRADFLERLAALLAVCLDSAVSNEKLKRAGLTDALTGVHNRRYFESRCVEEVQAARRSRLPLTCVMLDVDHFKRVNDGYGHPAGDAVLRYVARIIRAQLRGHDVVARYGGEEFVILLPATPLDAAVDTADRIRRVIAAQTMPVPDAPTLRVTVSMGLARLQADEVPVASVEQQVATLVARADQALYAAKQGGRNRCVSHD